MKAWKKFDISEKVKFCERHKRIFDEKVRVKAGRFKVININELVAFQEAIKTCTDCRWETLFGR